jgi:hypothetical protein
MATMKANPTLLLESWNVVVEVQRHFNDICLRIRSLALTALTFILGGTAFAYLNASSVALPYVGPLSPAAFLPLIGVPLWVAFWIIDLRWYHRLLRGAVVEGKEIESKLSSLGVAISLSLAIENASRYPKGRMRDRGRKRGTPYKAARASRRLIAFYVCGAVALGLASLTTGLLSAMDPGAIACEAAGCLVEKALGSLR